MQKTRNQSENETTTKKDFISIKQKKSETEKDFVEQFQNEIHQYNQFLANHSVFGKTNRLF